MRCSRALAPLLLALGLVACGGGGEGSTPGAPAGLERPNVLFVTLDTLRADHLGCYGYFRETSPRLDALADESVLFEHCTVPMATTLPSHVSMLTSTWPLEHGVLANVTHGGKAFAISPGLVPLSKTLSDAGYRTGAFISAKPLRPNSGIQAGFEHFDDSEGPERDGAITVTRALEWLRQDEPRPFFLWVHLFDPHSPFTPKPGYAGRFEADADLDAWLAERDVAEVSRRPGGAVVPTKPSTDDYDAEILYTDAQVGRLLDALDELGVAERTAVMVVTDHGEGMGQHGEPGHGLVWQEQVRAAWILHVPGLAPRRVSETVSTVDVFPTLLGRVAIPGVESFLEQASGIDALAVGFEGRPLFSQSSARLVEYGQPVIYTLTRDRWRYHWLGDERGLLFDLTTDPHELADVAAEHPELVKRLRDELLGTIAELAARGGELGAGEAVPLDAATLQALRDLGYTSTDDE